VSLKTLFPLHALRAWSREKEYEKDEGSCWAQLRWRGNEIALNKCGLPPHHRSPLDNNLETIPITIDICFFQRVCHTSRRSFGFWMSTFSVLTATSEFQFWFLTEIERISYRTNSWGSLIRLTSQPQAWLLWVTVCTCHRHCMTLIQSPWGSTEQLLGTVTGTRRLQQMGQVRDIKVTFVLLSCNLRTCATLML